MSLVCHETAEELQKVLAHLSSQPNFYDYLTYTNPIRIQLGPGFPPALKVYSFEKNGTTYWMQHREWKVVISHDFVAAVGPVNKEDLFEALELFNQEVHIFSDGQLHVLAGTEEVIKLAAEFHKFKNAEAKVTFYPCHRYYMNRDQKELMLNAELPKLPEGYELGSVSDEDCGILVKNWRHSEANELEHTRNKVKYLPSSAIRLNGELVGHEIIDGVGILTNQFVHLDHRGKGLGTTLEMDISKKLNGMGFDVVKHVELYNVDVVKMTERSKFWSLATNAEGIESSILFAILNEAENHANV